MGGGQLRQIQIHSLMLMQQQPQLAEKACAPYAKGMQHTFGLWNGCSTTRVVRLSKFDKVVCDYHFCLECLGHWVSFDVIELLEIIYTCLHVSECAVATSAIHPAKLVRVPKRVSVPYQCPLRGGYITAVHSPCMIDHSTMSSPMVQRATFMYDMHGELIWSTVAAYSPQTPGARQPRGTPSDRWNQQLVAGGNGEGMVWCPGRPDKIGGATHVSR